jgi:FtsP/CotA-like multicopper oxidase with cupredoxin domain
MLTRRKLVLSGAGFAAGAGLAMFGGHRFFRAQAAAAEAGPARNVPVHLIAAERQTALPCFAGHSLPLWTYAEGAWPPTIRIDLGDRLDVVLDNRLPRDGEHTSIHWHGVRVPNDQDGVPYLVQPPVAPGETFHYSFVPPDTGTFFFHSHCNSSEQLGRGLVGILIVDGDAVEPYAADQTLVLHDWLMDVDAGTFRGFKTKRGADRAGTYGNIRSVNGVSDAEIRLPASGDCRVRLINVDPTRIMEIAVVGTDAAIIAVDGNPLPPVPLDGWLLGPAMRLDLALRAPKEGGEATLVDRRQDEPVRLARFVGVGGPPAPTKSFDPRPLRAGRIPEPDIVTAERLSFTLGRADSGGAAIAVNDVASGLPIGPICTASDHFWTINGRSWPDGGHAVIPPPLATLERGRSYVFELKNTTDFLHPVHIHGHTFKVLHADRRSQPIHYADTVLVTPEEKVEIAFVADNPGRWMMHCHVIEHQETGMMGYLQVG